MKFDIRVMKDFLQSIDLTRGLLARNGLDLEEADNITKAIKHQLSEYLDSVYDVPAPEKKPDPKKGEQSGTPSTDKPDKKSPSSK